MIRITLAIVFFSHALIGCSPTSPYPAAEVPVTIKDSLKDKTCTSHTDQNGHVHLYSDDGVAAFACFGYLHAANRAWQMDYFRRIVQGRSAELHGFSKLKSDFSLRTLGIYEHALEIEKSLDANTAQNLWAYAYGVNKKFAELKSGDVYEFDELKYRPEPWRPADSIALLMLQSLDQTKKTFLSEIDETEWMKKFGDDRIRDFFEDGLPWDTSILKTGEYSPAQVAAASVEGSHLSIPQDVRSWFSNLSGNDTGSNNWVISKNRSKTKNAWLANDPHLDLKNPPFWFWVNFETKDVNAMGASFPGIPTVASGLNKSLAWGLTNAYLDAGQLAYISEDELVKAKSVRPTIYVDWHGIKLPFVFKTYRRTEQNLPILPLDAPSGKALVVNWTGLSIGGQNVAAVLNIMSSKSVGEMKAALQAVNIPSWNYVFADTNGNIGYQVTGPSLRHEITTAPGVSDVKLGELSKLPYLAPDEMPQLVNPKRGFIATANNRQWPKDGKFHGGYGYRMSMRAFRIEELLEKEPTHDLASIQKIQCDIQSVEGRFFVPALLSRLADQKLSDAQKKALVVLRGWNFQTDTQCKACGVYRRWIDRLLSVTSLNEDALYRRLNRDTSNEFVDTLKNQLDLALSDLKKGSGEEFPEWGKIHRAYFRHVSGDQRFFNKESIPTTGDENVVNPGPGDWIDNQYSHRSGASQRLIVELSNPPRAWVQLAGSNPDMKNPNLGESDSPWKRWSECLYREVVFPLNWAEVQKQEVKF